MRRDREAAALVRTCIASKTVPPCGADSCMETYLNDFPAGDYHSELIGLNAQTNERCRLAERDTEGQFAKDQDRIKQGQTAEEQPRRMAVETQRAEAQAREKARPAAEERNRAAVAAREKAAREAEERQRAKTQAQALEREREQAKREGAERERAQAKRELEEREKAETAARDLAARGAEAQRRTLLAAREMQAPNQSGQLAGVLAVPDGDYIGRTSREEGCSQAVTSVIVTIKDGMVCWQHDLNFANRWSGTIAPSGAVDARVRGRTGTSATGQVVNGGTMSIEMTYPECNSRIRINQLHMIGVASSCQQ